MHHRIHVIVENTVHVGGSRRFRRESSPCGLEIGSWTIILISRLPVSPRLTIFLPEVEAGLRVDERHEFVGRIRLEML